MPESALVSVIMPVYNGAKFIEAAIKSVFDQTYGNLELIVVDDGSTDPTSKLVQAYQDKRLRYFKTENHGVSAARNFGIEKARGDWLAFLDADDIWLPEKLSLQSKYFADFDIICSNGRYLDGARDGKTLFEPGVLKHFDLNGLSDLVLQDFIQLGSACIKRSTLADGRFNSALHYGEDYDLWLRLMSGGAKLKALEDYVFLYRQHGESAVAVIPDEDLKIAAILAKFSEREGLDSQIRGKAKSQAAKYYYHYCQEQFETSGFAKVWRLSADASNYAISPISVLWLAAKLAVKRPLERQRSSNEK